MLKSNFVHLMFWCSLWGVLVTGLMTAEDKLSRSRQVIKGLKPSEIALLQFDSRNLEDYWLTSAVWNDNYAKMHGHKFLYYSLTKGTFSWILC